MWKLDSPAALRAEAEERVRVGAEAARKKMEGALERKVRCMWLWVGFGAQQTDRRRRVS